MIGECLGSNEVFFFGWETIFVLISDMKEEKLRLNIRRYHRTKTELGWKDNYSIFFYYYYDYWRDSAALTYIVADTKDNKYPNFLWNSVGLTT